MTLLPLFTLAALLTTVWAQTPPAPAPTTPAPTTPAPTFAAAPPPPKGCDTTINLENDCSDLYNSNFDGMSASLEAMHDSLIDLQTNQITCTLELLSKTEEAVQRHISHACLQIGECCDANNLKEPDDCTGHCCPEECTLPIYPAPPGGYMVSKCPGPTKIPDGMFPYPGRYLISSIDGDRYGEGSWELGTGLSGDMCFEFCANNDECHSATYDCRTKTCTGWNNCYQYKEADHCGFSNQFENLIDDQYSYHVRKAACYQPSIPSCYYYPPYYPGVQGTFPPQF